MEGGPQRVRLMLKLSPEAETEPGWRVQGWSGSTWTLPMAVRSPVACFTGDTWPGWDRVESKDGAAGDPVPTLQPLGASPSFFYPEGTAWGDADEGAL